jgi:acyl carrier protein
MKRDEVLEKLRYILSERLKIVSEPDLINESTNLKTDFNISSMKIVSLIVELEENFCISINLEDLFVENLTDIARMITFLLKYDIQPGTSSNV